MVFVLFIRSFKNCCERESYLYKFIVSRVIPRYNKFKSQPRVSCYSYSKAVKFLKNSLLIVTSQNLLIFVCDHLGIYIADWNKYSSQCTGNEKRAKFDEEKFLSWPACLLVDLVMFFWSVLLLFHIYFFKNVLVLILLKENEVDTLWSYHLKNWKSY